MWLWLPGPCRATSAAHLAPGLVHAALCRCGISFLPPGTTQEFPISQDGLTTQQLVYLRFSRLQDPAQLAKVGKSCGAACVHEGGHGQGKGWAVFPCGLCCLSICGANHLPPLHPEAHRLSCAGRRPGSPRLTTFLFDHGRRSTLTGMTL